jgi:hypothetical protein
MLLSKTSPYCSGADTHLVWYTLANLSAHPRTSRGTYKIRTWDVEYYSGPSLINLIARKLFRLHIFNTFIFILQIHIMLASLLTLGLATLTYALPTTELVARDLPKPEDVYFQRLSWNGIGCPGKTVTNSTSSDRQTLVRRTVSRSNNNLPLF